jgi:hypothetical protein
MMKRGNAMPWTGKSFRAKHNKSLTPPQASSAARQASAMVRSGLPDDEAIRVANARIKRLRRRGSITDKAAGNLVHAANKRLYQKYGPKAFGDRYAGTDQQPLDASSR